MPDIFKIMITPMALTFGALVGTWRTSLDWGRDVGLQLPKAKDVIIFSAGFIIMMILHELLYAFAGMGAQQNDWRKYTSGALALRIVFVGLIYPVAEELFFRGFLLGLVTRKAGAAAGIFISAALFAALHGFTAGSWIGPLLLVMDGVYFAFARLRSGSLLLPIGFHIFGNSVAIIQRLY